MKPYTCSTKQPDINKQIEGTLIVTSAVCSRDPSLTVKDRYARLLQLYCSMICWITQTKIINIILCDNSCPEDVFHSLKILADSYNKQIEILVFNGDHDKVVRYGKGYGEGEIIEYVLNNSKSIDSATFFFKITGRVFVENFDEIMDAEKNREVVFNIRINRWKKYVWSMIANVPVFDSTVKGYISTVFYKCNVQYYRNNLSQCHNNVNDKKKNRGLENMMFQPVMKSGFSTFKITPRLVGQCAGTGKMYGSTDFPLEIIEQAKTMIAGKMPIISG